MKRKNSYIIVTILSDLNIPTCALRIIISYLTNRRMCVRFNGAESVEQPIPGGGPQGGLFTVIFFNLQVNLAGVPCPLPTILPVGVQGPEVGPLHAGPLQPCQQKEKTLKKKYVDDLSLLEALDLKSSLVRATPIVGPVNLHELPGLELPPDRSVLQHQLDDLLKFTVANKMKVNNKKTKIMPFNFSKNFEFLPQLYFPGESPLEVIYQTRLLGVTITSNLSWNVHVNYITKRATKNLLVLIRFRSLNGTRTQLLAIYLARVRSVLEFAAPVFSTSLTKAQSRQIESVQKKAFAIILGREYLNYETALKILGQERLSTRRTNLCYSFALKCSMSKKHASMFPLNDSPNQNTRNRKPFLEFKCNTSRYYNSPIPSLTRLLNNPPVPQTE